MLSARVVLVSCLSVAAAAQACARPVPPAGGHPTAVDLAVTTTYSDGYVTFASLIRPSTPPPTCGWPLVVHVHPLGQTRGFDLDLQMLIAGQGYAVWSYDVRGQGQAVGANPGHAQAGSTLMGPIERCDLAEQIQFVASNPAYAGVIDATRIAVLGSSQGAAHAWSAAAWSGQLLTVQGRPPITFPTIACVVPTDFVADAIDDWLRGGRLFSSWFVEAISGSYQGMPFDPVFLQTCRNAFQAQDPASLLAAFVAEGRPIGTQLATSTVPVLYAHAYLDLVDSPLSAITRLEAMGGPHRALLGTIGHNVAENLAERAYRRSLIVRWLHRWLWNELNEVELEQRYVLPELPLRQMDRDDPAHLWSRTHTGALTTPVSAVRRWLQDGGTLETQAPTSPQPAAIIQQLIDPLATFTPQTYLAQPAVRDVQNVLTVCPLQELVYACTTVAETQIAASATLSVEVRPHDPEWMLAALLTVQPPEPGADEVLVASQAFTASTSSPNTTEIHEVRLPPIAVRIPAGSTIRVRLRNLWLRELPMPHTLETAPLFHDFRVDVLHGDDTWIDLPLQPVAPRLVADQTWLDLASPVPITTTIRGGAARGGYPYFALVGLSGQLPTVPYLNEEIPIEADWLAVASAGAAYPPYFTAFLGFLDASGETTCTCDLTSVVLPQGLNGYRLTFAAFVWDGPWAPTGAASNPCDVMMR
jgi:predicted acyl esterase